MRVNLGNCIAVIRCNKGLMGTGYTGKVKIRPVL